MADPLEPEVSGDLPDVPKRSLRDLIRFQKWQIKEQRTLGELKKKLRDEVEKLFVARSWPSIAEIISAFRVYAEGVFDLNAEFLLEEERGTAWDYEDQLRLESKKLGHIFGYVVRGSSDGGKTFSDGGQPIGGVYKEIIGAALDLRARAKGTADDLDWRFGRGSAFPEYEHPQDFYLSLDISSHLQDSLQDRIHHWAAEFLSRRGPLSRLVSIDAERSTVASQKTAAEWQAENGTRPLDTPVRMEGATADPEIVANVGDGGSRRAAVDAYIKEVLRSGKVITRKDIWKAAGYKSRTEFERWERNDPKRPNKAAHGNFTRILTEKPHLK